MEKFSITQRLDFHKKRAQSSNISVNKKSYSLNWLDGFNDTHAENNYRAVCAEIAAKKQRGGLTRNERIVLNGYKNGLKANLDNRKMGR